MITIDGKEGEGGGQMLRTALSLALLTGRPFRIENIRAGREKPGLMRQHVTCVEAACAVSGATVSGLSIGSTDLTFRPATVRPGRYHFAVGTAGSTSLVLQTILLPLLGLREASIVTIEGGTHAMSAPPFEFLSEAFLPVLKRMGAGVDLRLVRHGFHPRGGGRIVAEIAPSELTPLEMMDRGALEAESGLVLNAALPSDIAHRELKALRTDLPWPETAFALRELPEERGPGNVILLKARYQQVTEIVTGFARHGVPAPRIARQAAARMSGYQKSSAAVGPYLADQILLPMALAGRCRFTTVKPSSHTHSNARIIERFLPARIAVSMEEDRHVVTIGDG